MSASKSHSVPKNLENTLKALLTFFLKPTHEVLFHIRTVIHYTNGLRRSQVVLKQLIELRELCQLVLTQ